MAHWTEHTQFNFHVENLTNITRDELALFIQQATGECTMVSDYVGAWDGMVTESFKVTWIAPHDMHEQMQRVKMHELNNVICRMTGNKCLMPTRETIEVLCSCDDDHETLSFQDSGR